MSLALVGVYHFLRLAGWMRKITGPPLPAPSGGTGDYPPISVLRPVKGLDPGAEENFRALLEQDYPQMEVVFSLQDPDDPALPVIRRLVADYPHIPIRILVNPVLPGFNGKSSNLVHAARASSHDLLVVLDSDVRPDDGLLLRRLAAGVLHPRPNASRTVGAACALCFYRGAQNFWGRLLQLETNLLMTQVGMLNAAWGDLQAGIGGAAFIVRKSALAQVGGFEAFGDSVAEDIALGKALVRAGYGIRWVARASCQVQSTTFRELVDNLKRWALADFALSKPHWAAHLAVNRLYAYALLAGLFLPGLRVPALAYMGLKIAFAMVAERFFARSQPAWWALLVPAADMFLALAFPLFLLFPYFRWRGIPYRVDRKGRVTPLRHGGMPL